jgi:hypothetical protein
MALTLNYPTKSYKNNNVNEPALHVGVALPSEEERGC